MNNKLTIIMYHYVRELKGRFAGIKGLLVDDFIKQLKWIERYYSFVSIQDVISAIDKKIDLPNNSVLLTFDDGYKDHYKNVYPILKEKKISATFFVPAKPIIEGVLLDVNKIHYILAVAEIVDLVKRVKGLLKNHNIDGDFYYQKLAVPNRWDSADIIFIKRLFQRELPEEDRKIILNELFLEFVGEEERSLSENLYVQPEDVKEMSMHGMNVGSHGYSHRWLGYLSKEQQEEEIRRSLDFLLSMGVPKDYLSIAYPQGSYNEDTIEIIKRNGFKVGISTKVDLVDLNRLSDMDYRFVLPRIDTNDLPPRGDYVCNKWLVKAQQ